MAGRPGAPDLFADAIEMLREADRLHRHFFTLGLGASGACWEPPVDIVEGESTVTICVALPGVGAGDVQVRTDGKGLHVVGVRRLAARSGQTIHRLEIPHGRFERRIELPPGRYDIRGHDLADGCLVITLHRMA